MSEDIFEKYAELAMERGLVSKGDDLKKKLEKNPRWDSQDISTIELLYGVKPDSPKEMEYKKNIVEIAHPNAVVVSPAHDPLNGLVENLNERNNILINIVNKMPDGHLTGRKYASDELVRSLVRIANDMDNHDSDELRVLADTCIEQMKKKAYALLIVGAVLAVLGGVYLQQHLDMADKGLEENGKTLIGELEDFMGDHLIGTDYTDDFQATIQKIIDRVKTLLSKYGEFKQAIDNLQRPKDLEEMQAYVGGRSTEGPSIEDFPKMYQEFSALVSKANALFTQIEKRFGDVSYQTGQMKNMGVGERINRLFGGIFSGDKLSLVSNDFKDVLRALAPFRESLTSVLVTLKNANEQAKKDYADMQAAAAAKPENATPAKPATPPAPAAPGKPAQNAPSGNPLAGFNVEKAEKELDT